jgi:hypothetical protein
MTENFTLFLGVLGTSLLLMVVFISLTRGSLAEWIENKKYIDKIPLKSEINWDNPFNESHHRRGSLKSNIEKEKKILDYVIYKVSVIEDVGDGYINNRDKKFFFKQKNK